MTLSTLNYIRDLLEENERKTRKAYELAEEAWNNAVKTDACNEYALLSMRDKVHATWSQAWDAWQEFENHEW